MTTTGARKGAWEVLEERDAASVAGLVHSIDEGRHHRRDALVWQLCIAPMCWLAAAGVPSARLFILAGAIGASALFLMNHYRDARPRLRLLRKLMTIWSVPRPEAERAYVRFRRVTLCGQILHAASLVASLVLLAAALSLQVP